MFGYVTAQPEDPAPGDAVAMVDEGPSRTYVVPLEAGSANPFPAAWLTLDVRSSLDAIGLTAAVAAALVARAIPVNVLAGFHHDHLLVPEELADAAIAALHELRADH